MSGTMIMRLAHVGSIYHLLFSLAVLRLYLNAEHEADLSPHGDYATRDHAGNTEVLPNPVGDLACCTRVAASHTPH